MRRNGIAPPTSARALAALRFDFVWCCLCSFDVKGLPTVYLSSRGTRDSPVRMEVQGSADEIVPNMLAFLKEHTASTGATTEAGEGAEQPTPEATAAADHDRDL